MLVRKNAPNRLLLGTDAQSSLGYMLIKKDAKDGGVGLTTGETVQLNSESIQGHQKSDTVQEVSKSERRPPEAGCEGSKFEDPAPGKQPLDQSTTIPTGVVCLLNATRIPAGYKKMVRAKVEGHIHEKMSLFTPTPQEDGLMIADSAVDLSDGSCVILVVQNPGTIPIKMKKGCVLGEVIPATEYSPDKRKDEEDIEDTTEAMVCSMSPAADSSRDREMELLQQLNLKTDHLSSEE